MSIDVMTALWRTCLFQGNTLLVLLAYADWANDDGSNVFPGINLVAAKCRVAVRTVRYSNEELCKSGALVKVTHDRGGRGNFVEYSIHLERLQELQALHESENPDCEWCREKKLARERTARIRAERMQRESKRMQRPATKAARGDGKDANSAAHIDNNHQHPSEHPSPPGAPTRASREADDVSDSAPKTSGQSRCPYSDPFERIWAEIRKWPGFNPEIMSKPEAFKAFKEVEAELPSTDNVVAAARGFGRGLERENARRRPGDPHRVIHPANWFLRRRWVADDDPAPFADESVRLATIGKEIVDRLRGAGLPDKVIAAWFADGEFDTGPPPIFRVASQFRANAIANRYGSQLERAFGAPVMVVANQAAADSSIP